MIGLNLAILRNLQPIRRHALTMSLNWSMYGLFFWTTRELLISEQPNPSEMFSSTVAGAMTGGILAFISRAQKRAVISGALLFAAMSAAGQVVFSMANSKRQAMIVEKLQPPTPKQETRWLERWKQKWLVDPVTLLPEWFPLRRIPNEEYRSLLVNRRAEILVELKSIRESIDRMDRREKYLLELK